MVRRLILLVCARKKVLAGIGPSKVEIGRYLLLASGPDPGGAPLGDNAISILIAGNRNKILYCPGAQC
jgi:hypothetical protein